MSSEAELRARLDERLELALGATPVSAPAEPGELLAFSLSPGRGPAGRVLLLLKRVMRRLLREVLGRQTRWNRSVQIQLTAMRAELAAAEQHADLYAGALRETTRRLAALEAAGAGSREGAAVLSTELEQIATDVRALGSRVGALDGESGAPRFDYLGFTDHFRGAEEEIRARQRNYVARFAGLSEVLDIGCGRGEFLRLLDENGIPARGVDLEPSMVEHCREQGFQAIRDDALAHLESLPEESLGGIYAAQVIEHLQPARILRLLELGRSRLRPGGLMLLESVNPQSLITFTSFYVDPTHVKPVHPLALEWLMNALGFEAVEIEYASPVESEQLLRIPLPDQPSFKQEASAESAVAATNAVLYGPREYAILGRRP